MTVGFIVFFGRILLETTHIIRKATVFLARTIRRARNNQRGPCLINQHVVNLVDDGINQIALNQLVAAGGHVVAQVVKTKFAADAVGDISQISLLARTRSPMDQTFIFQLGAGIHVVGIVKSREFLRANTANRQT